MVLVTSRRRASIRGALRASLAVVLVSLMFAGLLLVALAWSVDRYHDQVRDRSARGRVIGPLRDDLLHFDGVADEYALTRSGAAERRFFEAILAIDQGFDRLAHADLPAGVGFAELARAEWMFGRNIAVQAFWAGRGSEVDEELEGSITRSSAALGRLVAAARARSDTQNKRSAEVIQTLGLVFIVFVIAAGTLCAVLLRRLKKSIAGPVEELRNAAECIAEDRPFERLPLDHAHEFSQVAAAFNAMADKLEESRAELVHNAFHDPLTKLANRSLFSDRAEHALARANRQKGHVGIAFIDLDDFKAVNDTMGHSAGDELLVEVARRLEAVVRDEDTLARFGGDEFALLVDELRNEDEVSAATQRLMQQLETPIEVQGRRILVRASVGIAVSGSGGRTVEELLRSADVAMYAAKESGKGALRIFEPSMHATVLDRLETEAYLKSALELDQFVLRYQPIVDMRSGRILGVEALLRWQHPKLGLLDPEEFIELAERTSVILEVGRWVLEQASREVRKFQLRDPDNAELFVCVNLSPRQIEQPGLVNDVRDALERSGLAPQHMLLEVTEGSLVRHGEISAAVVQDLKEIGVRIAIDDFGTGYASLGYLQRFPVDVIKIDKSFVQSLSSDDNQDWAVARAVIKLGHNLGIELIAEGIESEVQAGRLLNSGCTLGQGFLFSTPLDLEASGLKLAPASFLNLSNF